MMLFSFDHYNRQPSWAAFAAAAAVGGGYAAEALVEVVAEGQHLEWALDEAERRARARHDADAAECRALYGDDDDDDDGQRGPGPRRFDRLILDGTLVAAAYGGGRSRAIIREIEGGWQVAVEADSDGASGATYAARIAAAAAILGPPIGEGPASPFGR